MLQTRALIQIQGTQADPKKDSNVQGLNLAQHITSTKTFQN
jgi:hypothetical protein